MNEVVIPRALIADDQSDVLIALQLLLKGEGFQIESASSPASILEKVTANKYDVLLMDMNYARDTTSGREGLALIARIRDLDQSLPVIAMTAWGSIELAVEAMQRGLREIYSERLWEIKDYFAPSLRRCFASSFFGSCVICVFSPSAETCGAFLTLTP